MKKGCVAAYDTAGAKRMRAGPERNRRGVQLNQR
jgi:hypothetical protein